MMRSWAADLNCVDRGRIILLNLLKRFGESEFGLLLYAKTVLNTAV